NEFIHDLQDAPRQAAIVDQYTKWSYELRAPEAVDGVLRRAVQFAAAEPQGPVYVAAAREIWEVPASGRDPASEAWRLPRLGGLPAGVAAGIAEAIAASRRGLVITSYLGRRPAAVGRLVALAERAGVGVVEVSPSCLSFPGTHPHHLGYRRNR